MRQRDPEEEIAELAARVVALEGLRDAAARLARRLKGWVVGSVGTALLAAATALYGLGVRKGLSEAAEAQAVAERALRAEATAANHRQDIEINVLRARLDEALYRLNREDR